MPPYRAVCLDVDGTLYPASVMRRKMAAIYARNPAFALRYIKMRKALRLVQSSFDEESLLSFREREASVMHCSAGDLDRFIYNPMEKAYITLKPFDGVTDTLRRLKSEGVKIGILSDFPLFGKLRAMGIESLADVALSSDDTGFLKPDVHGFEILLYKLGVRPCDALFAGDNAKTDVKGARMAGIDAYHFSTWNGLDSFLLERGL